MAHFEDLMWHVLIQLAVILGAARTGALLLRKLGQPEVVGEIAAGLVLGPSVLGRWTPGLGEFLFPAEVAIVFRVLSELGLVLLMFLMGLEFDFSHLREVGRRAAGVAAAGIALPFLLGIGLGLWMHPQVASEVNRTGFVLIVSVALSITAIPILGRILMELDLHRTPLGTLIITAAAIDDALGWILLAGISALIHGNFAMASIVRMVALVVAFVITCRYGARPFLFFWAGRLQSSSGTLSTAGLSCLLVIVLLAAAVTNAIGIFSIFGPFVLGAVLSDRMEFRETVGRSLRDLIYALFLPIFFTYTGLRTDVGFLTTYNDWWMCGLVIVIATVGKMMGCGLAARAGGMSWRDCGCVAVMMNTRALMGLIAINVGRDLGVIPDRVFCMLVIMALVTTFATTPIMRRLLVEVR